jgi:putative phosphoesterase
VNSLGRLQPLKIGVIADTHGWLDPQAPALFAGVDYILHGGDIGSSDVLAGLEVVAPVTAVSGNTDCDPAWRDTEILELAGRTFLLQHIVDPHRPDPALRERLNRVRPDVVIFGHTHQPLAETIGGILFLNPGSAKSPRGGTPRSIAILHCSPDGLRHRFVELR